MKLGVFIGSFNPPHKGHIDVVNYLLKRKYVDKILIVPTGNYWDKQNLESINHRVNMLKFFENKKIKVDNQNNNYPYTIDLMRKLEKIYVNDDLYLIIGMDNLINFDKWKEYQNLLKYHIIVMNRNNLDVREYLDKLNGNFIVVSNYPFINISSSEIIKKKKYNYLDEKVLNYIKENNLYW